MSFLFRRNSKKTNEATKQLNEVSGYSDFVNELRQSKKEYQEQRRKHIVNSFVERVTVLFEKIIKTESSKGKYSVERKNLTITTRDSDLLTDSDRISISDKIKTKFLDYFVSVAVKTNSVDILIKWETIANMWSETPAYENKMMADNYNKLPYLTDNSIGPESVEPPHEIVDDILLYLLNSTLSYGTIPTRYTYKFPHIATTVKENSNYRKTMNEVIKLLPDSFQSVKGSFQRTTKNAIISFMLEFVIDM